MAAPKSQPPKSERVERARLAAHASWAKTEDRSARTAAARAKSPTSLDYWRKQVDPEGALDPEVREKMATSAHKAHMARLAYKSVKAARLRREAKGGSGE